MLNYPGTPPVFYGLKFFLLRTNRVDCAFSFAFMNNMLQQLHLQYCDDLNRAWLNADPCEFRLEDYDPLVGMLNEANEHGYEFTLTRDPGRLIEKRIMNTIHEKELLCMEAWNKMQVMNNMIEECSNKGWKKLHDGYQSLRSHLINSMLSEYAVSFIKNHGPFFPGEQLDQIEVFGHTGSISKDMLIVAIICGQSRYGNQLKKPNQS